MGDDIIPECDAAPGPDPRHAMTALDMPDGQQVAQLCDAQGVPMASVVVGPGGYLRTTDGAYISRDGPTQLYVPTGFRRLGENDG